MDKKYKFQPIRDLNLVGNRIRKELESDPNMELLGHVEWKGVSSGDAILQEFFSSNPEILSPFTTLTRSIDKYIVHYHLGGKNMGVVYGFTLEEAPTPEQFLVDQLNVQTFDPVFRAGKPVYCRLLGMDRWLCPTSKEDYNRHPNKLETIFEY